VDLDPIDLVFLTGWRRDPSLKEFSEVHSRWPKAVQEELAADSGSSGLCEAAV